MSILVSRPRLGNRILKARPYSDADAAHEAGYRCGWDGEDALPPGE